MTVSASNSEAAERKNDRERDGDEQLSLESLQRQAAARKR